MERTEERKDGLAGCGIRELPEGALATRSRGGEVSAFEELVRRYRNDVFRLSYHFVRNREEAWDISQEVFIKAYNGLRGFRGDSDFKAWVMRITANQCKDFLKKRRVPMASFQDTLQAESASSGQLDPRHAVEAEELGQAIESALNGLSHKHRTAFILREFEGLSYEQMAGVMHCSLGTVMSRLHHARKNLQRGLTHMGVI